MWKQRAQITWFHKGDANITYFHTIAHGRHRRKFISAFKKIYDIFLEYEQAIISEIISFYSQHFSEENRWFLV